jgi:hypothetical protein
MYTAQAAPALMAGRNHFFIRVHDVSFGGSKEAADVISSFTILSSSARLGASALMLYAAL